FAFRRAPVADGQEAREIGEGGAVLWVDDEIRRAVAEDEPSADDEAQALLFGHDMRAHDAGERVSVGDADGGQTESFGLFHHFFGMGAAPQEREICRYAEFSEAHARALSEPAHELKPETGSQKS